MRITVASLASAAACAAGLAAHASLAATYFESETMTRGGGANQTMSVRAWVDGPQAKIEFQETDQSGLFGAGSYMLTQDGGSTIYLVDPAEQTYSEINLDELLGMAGSVMQATGGVVQMEFSDFSNDKLAEEPGGEVLGFPTTRYEYQSGYTMSVGVLGFKREMRNDMRQEFWCTDELDAEGFRVWLSPDRFRTGNAEIDELIETQYQDLDCLPLRSRTTTTTSGQGPEATTETTSEVTVLRQDEAVDASTFEVPEGYTAVSFMPELPGGFEFPGGAEPPQGQDEGEERRRPRLRDLLR